MFSKSLLDLIEYYKYFQDNELEIHDQRISLE